MRRNPELAEIVTGMVRDWIQRQGVKHPDLAGAVQMVHALDHLPSATKQLEAWFLEQLTFDPGATRPFSDLGQNLLSAVLDQVDWETVTRLIMEREE